MPEIDAFVEPDKLEWPPLFERFLQHLKLEEIAEEIRLRENPELGFRLTGLRLSQQWTALAGRVICQFTLKNRDSPLPYHGFRVGAPIVILGPAGEVISRGLVATLRRNLIEVVVPDFWDDEVEVFTIAPSADEVTRARMRQALVRATSTTSGRLAELRDVLLGETAPQWSDQKEKTPSPATLNAVQWQAIQHALAAQDVAVIHGPPGTGKTVTLAYLIAIATGRGQKVLACGPSNLSVDNLVLRLLSLGVKAVRLGHPARVSESLHDATLDFLVKNHPDYQLADKLIRQAQTLQQQAARYTRAKPAPGEKREMNDEARSLMEDAQRIQTQTLNQILDQADVLCSTLTGIDDDLLGSRRFDLGVIDEACQTVEPACWIPLAKVDRVILAGDHCQLPPTILSRETAQAGFDVSLQQRMVARYPKAAQRLEVQYRMHEHIMGFSSREFYEGTLVADATVIQHQLDLPENDAIYFDLKPVQFFDTAGADYREERDEKTGSRANPQEATFLLRKCQQVLDAGVPPTAISVITPYSAQARLLEPQLPQEVEVDTIDGFQGRENDVVLISLVRSNESGELGFLKDVRRMNVALTRARKKMVIVGDSATLASFPFYERFLAYLDEIGGYHTVWEEMYE